MGKAEAGLGNGKNYMPRGESTSALLLHGRRVLVSVVLMHWTLKLTAARVMSGQVVAWRCSEQHAAVGPGSS